MAGAVKWYAGLAFTPISVDELFGDDEQLAAIAARQRDKIRRLCSAESFEAKTVKMAT